MSRAWDDRTLIGPTRTGKAYLAELFSKYPDTQHWVYVTQRKEPVPEYKAVYVVQLLPDAKDADVLVEALFAYAQDRDAGDPLRRRALKLLAHIESKRTDVD